MAHFGVVRHSSGALEQGLESPPDRRRPRRRRGGRMARSGGGDVGGALRLEACSAFTRSRSRTLQNPETRPKIEGVRQLPFRRDARDQPQPRRDRSRPHPALRVPEPPHHRDGAPAPDAQRRHRDRAPARSIPSFSSRAGPAPAPPPGPRGRLLLSDHRRARGPRRGAGGRGLPALRPTGFSSGSSPRARRWRRCAGASAPPRGAVESGERRAPRGRQTAVPSSGTFTITCSGFSTSSRRTADVLGGLLESYLSQVSNRMNAVHEAPDRAGDDRPAVHRLSPDTSG